MLTELCRGQHLKSWLQLPEGHLIAQHGRHAQDELCGLGSIIDGRKGHTHGTVRPKLCGTVVQPRLLDGMCKGIREEGVSAAPLSLWLCYHHLHFVVRHLHKIEEASFIALTAVVITFTRNFCVPAYSSISGVQCQTIGHLTPLPSCQLPCT